MNAKQKVVKGVDYSRRKFLIGATAAAVIGIPALVDTFSQKPKGWLERLGTQATLEEITQDVSENLQKIKEVPHYAQSDSTFGRLPLKACTPISASNILMWYAQNGYPKLIEGFEGSYEKKHHQLIVILNQYMGTNPQNNGTTSQNAESGLRRFVEEKGYKLLQFEEVPYPSQEQLVRSVKDSLAIITKAKFSQGNKSDYTLERFSPHDMTLITASYRNGKLLLSARDSNMSGKPDPYALLVVSELRGPENNSLNGRLRIENALAYSGIEVITGVTPIRLSK